MSTKQLHSKILTTLTNCCSVDHLRNHSALSLFLPLLPQSEIAAFPRERLRRRRHISPNGREHFCSSSWLGRVWYELHKTLTFLQTVRVLTEKIVGPFLDFLQRSTKMPSDPLYA